ncbi:MAG: DUF1835 domain-containing protein [Bacteroidales bacterium]|jgi:hypothetical protein|nr:DUF1835 domain-containing protein [Bacteroidales bacterium]
MIQKDIHIIFGKVAKGSLIHSKKFDLDSIQMICLEDCLNLGPVCDLDSVEEIEKRNLWLSKVFEVPTSINGDIDTIKTFIENYRNEKIYLWTGLAVSEIMNTARLLYHLQPNCKNVFVFDFLNFSMKNICGEVVYPRCLTATDLSRVDEVEKNFRRLTDEELSKFRILWEKVKSGNSLLWILDENGQIVEKDETWFDSFLLSYCTREFQHPAWIIGHTLCDVDFNIGDLYLNYRMKQLVLMNKLEIRGKLGEMRDYMVKLPN